MLSNFRPTSKPPILSKVLEEVVFNQLQSFLVARDIDEKSQPGFKPRHGTQTAPLRLSKALLSAMDWGNSAVLVSLDRTAWII